MSVTVVYRASATPVVRSVPLGAKSRGSSNKENAPVLLDIGDRGLLLLQLLHVLQSLLVVALDLVVLFIHLNLPCLQLSEALDIGVVYPLEVELDGHRATLQDADVVALVDELHEFVGNLDFEFLQLIFDHRRLGRRVL